MPSIENEQPRHKRCKKCRVQFELHSYLRTVLTLLQDVSNPHKNRLSKKTNSGSRKSEIISIIRHDGTKNNSSSEYIYSICMSYHELSNHPVWKQTHITQETPIENATILNERERSLALKFIMHISCNYRMYTIVLIVRGNHICHRTIHT